MGKFTHIYLEGQSTTISDKTLGRHGFFVDQNYDGKLDFFAVGNQGRIQNRKDSNGRDVYCIPAEGWQVFAIKENLRKKAQLFAKEKLYLCKANIMNANAAKKRQAEKVFSEGKKRAYQLYDDYIKALKTKKVSYQRCSYRGCWEGKFTDSRGREITAEPTWEKNGKLLRMELLDKGYPRNQDCDEPDDPKKSCPQGDASHFLHVNVEDPKLVQKISEYFKPPSPNRW